MDNNNNNSQKRERSYSNSASTTGSIPSISTTTSTTTPTEDMAPNNSKKTGSSFMDLFSTKIPAPSKTNSRPRAPSWNEDQERKTTSQPSSAVMQELVLDTRKPVLASEFQEVDLQEAIVADREKAVKETQRDMVGLNQVFQDFALLVHEQGDAVENIERSVEQAKTHSKKAVKELESAEKKQEVSTAITATIATVGTAAVALIVLL